MADGPSRSQEALRDPTDLTRTGAVATPRNPRARRLVAVASLVLVAVAVLWSLLPGRLALTAARDQGLIQYAAPANGDQMYYTSMMLQYSGVGYRDSLDEVAAYFSYAGDWHKARFLNPDIAPLVYPRTVLPLLGDIFLPLMGIKAIFVPGILCGLGTLALIGVAARRWGATWALAPPLAIFVLSRGWSYWGTGLFTESVLMLVVVAAFLCLPLAGRRPSTSGFVWLGTLAIVASLTRQAGMLVPAMCVCAAAGDVLLSRGDRRSVLRLWLPYVGCSLLAGVTSTVAISKWAPYDVLAWTRLQYPGQSTSGALVSALTELPGKVGQAYAALFPGSIALALVLILGLAATVLLMREPLGWAILGAAAVPVATAALNGIDVLRYLSPVCPLFVVAQAVVLHRFLEPRSMHYRSLLSHHEHQAVSTQSRAARSMVLVAIATSALVIFASYVVSRPSPLEVVGKASAATLVGQWPLSVPSATVLCGGSDGEVWLRVKGIDYAFSGTALAHRDLWVPSAKDLRLPSTRPWAGQSLGLLTKTLDLCRVHPLA